MTSVESSPMLPSVLVFSARDKGRDLLRRAFTRRRARLQLVRTAAAADAALRASLVDVVVVDVCAGVSGAAAADDAWAVASMARELPSIPFFALAAPRLADAGVLGRCASLEVADVLIEGVDDGALRELVLPLAFTARFAAALQGAHTALGLDAPLQRRAWEMVVAAGGRPVRTEAIAVALEVTREHLSRAFAAAGAPNLKRVIDLVRLIAAAELAKNPGYDLADVATVLAFASPSHLANTAQRVAGIRAASLTRLRAQDLVARFRQGRSHSRG
jgi:AraC-like DNA-binding protein